MEAYQRLEHAWANHLNLDPAGMVACSSGTAALHLALEALQFPTGSFVLIPDYCMIAVPRAVSMARMTLLPIPVLDPLPPNQEQILLIDTAETLKVANRLRRSMPNLPTVALVVHTFGRRCDMNSIVYACDYVIEDLAEAHTVHPHHRTSAACWSFYKNKVVAGEEGGAVWFRDPWHANRARQLRSLGFTEEHDFLHIPRGHNYRLANSLAGLILGSLANIQENLLLRNLRVQWYDEMLPSPWMMPSRLTPWVYDIRIPGLTWENQLKIVKVLNHNNIPARCGFKPVTSQTEFLGNTDPTTQQLSEEVFYLPLDPLTVTAKSVSESVSLIHSMVSDLRL